MKKLMALSLSLMVLLSVGCSSTTTSESTAQVYSQTTENPEIAELKSQLSSLVAENQKLNESLESALATTTTETTTTVSPTTTEGSNVRIEGNKAIFEQIEFEIVDVLLAPAPFGDGEEQLVLFFDILNKDLEPFDGSNAIISVIDVYQETDSTIEYLEVGYTYYGEEGELGKRSENLDILIKKGGKIEVLMPYELKYKDEPVHIEFWQTSTDTMIGEIVIEPEIWNN